MIINVIAGHSITIFCLIIEVCVKKTIRRGFQVIPEFVICSPLMLLVTVMIMKRGRTFGRAFLKINESWGASQVQVFFPNHLGSSWFAICIDAVLGQILRLIANHPCILFKRKMLILFVMLSVNICYLWEFITFLAQKKFLPTEFKLIIALWVKAH